MPEDEIEYARALVEAAEDAASDSGLASCMRSDRRAALLAAEEAEEAIGSLLGSTAREALAVIEAVDLMRLSCTWDDACPEEGITCASEMALGGSGCDSCVTLAALEAWREAVRRHRGGGE